MALQTPDAESLYMLFLQAAKLGLKAIPFREPDLNNEITSIAFIPSPANKSFLSKLPLAGRRTGNTDKNNKTKELSR